MSEIAAEVSEWTSSLSLEYHTESSGSRTHPALWLRCRDSIFVRALRFRKGTKRYLQNASSTMLRTEKTTSFLFMSTFVGRFMNPDHVPFVYLERRDTKDSEPSMPERTSSKSERSGGSTAAKFASGLISFSAYVSVIALSMMASSSGVSPPSMMRNKPTSVMMLFRSTSAGFSSSRGTDRSNGLM